MDILKQFPIIIQNIAKECENLAQWFTKEIANINGVSIAPVNILLPSILLVILGFLIVRFILV